jgi:hypothetical protein
MCVCSEAIAMKVEITRAEARLILEYIKDFTNDDYRKIIKDRPVIVKIAKFVMDPSQTKGIFEYVAESGEAAPTSKEIKDRYVEYLKAKCKKELPKNTKIYEWLRSIFVSIGNIFGRLGRESVRAKVNEALFVKISSDDIVCDDLSQQKCSEAAHGKGKEKVSSNSSLDEGSSEESIDISLHAPLIPKNAARKAYSEASKGLDLNDQEKRDLESNIEKIINDPMYSNIVSNLIEVIQAARKIYAKNSKIGAFGYSDLIRELSNIAVYVTSLGGATHLKDEITTLVDAVNSASSEPLSFQEISRLLQTLSAIPVKERVSLSKITRNLNVPLDNRLRLMQWLVCIDGGMEVVGSTRSQSKKSKSLAKKTQSAIGTTVDKVQSLSKKSKKVKGKAEHKVSKRQSVINWYARNCANFEDKGIFSKEMLAILLSREDLRALRNGKIGDDALAEKLLAVMKELIGSADIAYLGVVADFIFQHRDDEIFSSERELLLKAIDIVAEENLDISFKIHKKLREMQGLSLSFTPPTQEFNGDRYAIDMSFFCSIPTLTLERQDLPPVTVKGWENLIDHASKELPGKASFLNLNLDVPVLKSLLGANGKVTLHEAKWKKVVEHLASLDSNPKTDGTPSMQAKRMLEISSAMEGCRTGKLEAVDDLYAELPLHMQYQLSLPAQSDGLSNIKPTVFRVVKECAAGMIGPLSPCAVELTGRHILDAHETLYLKNMLAHRFGVGHEYAFDDFALAINSNLRDMTQGDVLRAIFSHLTPLELASRLMEQLNGNLSELQGALSEVIGEHDYWDEGEDDMYNVNERGALKLLELAGAVIPIVE